jgi:hypothetical protein
LLYLGVLTGTVFSNGKVWQEQRKFMHATLNDLGMGRRDTMETIIEQETSSLVDRIREDKRKNKTFKVKGFFLYTVNNIIWRMVTGERTKYNDPDLLELIDGMLEFFDALNPGSLYSLLQMYSLPFAHICRVLFGKDSLLHKTEVFKKIMQKQVDLYQADAYGYFIEKYKAEILRHDDKPESSFHRADGALHLLAQMGDIFGAGEMTR